MKLPASLLVSVGLFLVAASDGGDAKSDLKKLEGTWKLVRAESEGQVLPEEDFKDSKLVIKGHKYDLKLGVNAITGTFKLDTTTKPKSIDAIDAERPDKGEIIRGIYEIKDDEFKVCFGEPDAARPKQFSDKDRIVHVWKRVKK